jgi:hypothetical protein
MVVWKPHGCRKQDAMIASISWQSCAAISVLKRRQQGDVDAV